uniref:Uncharacterized protein n=1 Tax=Ditylenchus dipsaci TaxID=166011 RepID=A0A915DDR8_9BILA
MESSRYYPPPYSPYTYPDYGNNIQTQGNRGPMDMQDLIGDLSLSLMRSFTNILGGGNSNNQLNPIGNSIAPLNRQPYLPPYTPPDLYGFGNNGQSSASNYGYRPSARYGPASYGAPSLPYPPGKSQSEFGYGVNAGVYAGTYGGNSVVGPMGPYGSVNNNVGGSYGGLSPWSPNLGNNWNSQRPQPIVPINNGGNNAPANNSQVAGPGAQQQTLPPIQTGTGTVVQIPLTEGLSGTNVVNPGELPMPVTPQEV